MNQRLSALLESMECNLRQIRELISDLETREQNPAFQIAKRLFAEGWRLQNWGATLTDTDNEIILTRDGQQIGYWSDGAGHNTKEAFQLIGLELTDESFEALAYLSDLTEEQE